MSKRNTTQTVRDHNWRGNTFVYRPPNTGDPLISVRSKPIMMRDAFEFRM